MAPSERWACAEVAPSQLAVSAGAFLRLRVLGALLGRLLGLGQAFTPGSPRQPHQRGESSSRRRESRAELETGWEHTPGSSVQILSGEPPSHRPSGKTTTQDDGPRGQRPADTVGTEASPLPRLGQLQRPQGDCRAR